MVGSPAETARQTRSPRATFEDYPLAPDQIKLCHIPGRSWISARRRLAEAASDEDGGQAGNNLGLARPTRRRRRGRWKTRRVCAARRAKMGWWRWRRGCRGLCRAAWPSFTGRGLGWKWGGGLKCTVSARYIKAEGGRLDSLLVASRKDSGE